MKLNKTALKALSVPAGKIESIVWDDDVPGFGVRLHVGGAAVWIFQYRLGGKQRRITFGDVGAMTPATARAKAEELRAQVRLGQDPAGAKAEARVQAAKTIGAEIPVYLNHLRERVQLPARHAEALKPRTYREIERHLTVHAKPLHALQANKVDRAVVTGLFDKLKVKNGRAGGPVVANGVRASLSGFFQWRFPRDTNAVNPVIGSAAANARISPNR